MATYYPSGIDLRPAYEYMKQGVVSEGLLQGAERGQKLYHDDLSMGLDLERDRRAREVHERQAQDRVTEAMAGLGMGPRSVRGGGGGGGGGGRGGGVAGVVDPQVSQSLSLPELAAGLQEDRAAWEAGRQNIADLEHLQEQFDMGLGEGIGADELQVVGQMNPGLLRDITELGENRGDGMVLTDAAGLEAALGGLLAQAEAETGGAPPENPLVQFGFGERDLPTPGALAGYIQRDPRFSQMHPMDRQRLFRDYRSFYTDLEANQAGRLAEVRAAQQADEIAKAEVFLGEQMRTLGQDIDSGELRMLAEQLVNYGAEPVEKMLGRLFNTHNTKLNLGVSWAKFNREVREDAETESAIMADEVARGDAATQLAYDQVAGPAMVQIQQIDADLQRVDQGILPENMDPADEEAVESYVLGLEQKREEAQRQIEVAGLRRDEEKRRTRISARRDKEQGRERERSREVVVEAEPEDRGGDPSAQRMIQSIENDVWDRYRDTVSLTAGQNRRLDQISNQVMKLNPDNRTEKQEIERLNQERKNILANVTGADGRPPITDLNELRTDPAYKNQFARIDELQPRAYPNLANRGDSMVLSPDARQMFVVKRGFVEQPDGSYQAPSGKSATVKQLNDLAAR